MIRRESAWIVFIAMVATLVPVAGNAVAQTTSSAQHTPGSRFDADGNLNEAAFHRMPLLGADQKYAALDGERIKALLYEVTDISRITRPAVEVNGNRFWGRIAGTRGEEATREWLKGKYQELGLTDIRTQEFDLPTQWFPTSYDIWVEAGGRAYRFESLVPALLSPATDGLLDVEAVWVGTGSAADFLGRDVRGKAVFIHSIPAPGQMGHSAANYWEGAIRRAREEGAAAIFVVYGLSDNFTVWMGGLGGVPGAYMGYQDGNVVKELIGTGEPVRVKMRLDVEYRDGLKTASVFGTLPGTTDEDVYVLAHLDGYFEAASDNASGIAVMLALAEYFSTIPQEQRRRNIVFIGTAAHHIYDARTGSYQGSPGSAWMRDHFDTAMTDAALMINVEHVSLVATVNWRGETRFTDMISPRRWWVNGSDELVELVLDAYRTFGVSVWDRMESSAAGEMIWVAPLLPSVQVIRSPAMKHTDQDVPRWVPAAGLEAMARAYAKIIDETDKLSRVQLGGPQISAQRAQR